MNILERHLVPENITRQRLSDYATGVFSAIPTRKGIKKAIKRGEVWINGAVAETGWWVEPGQIIELRESDRPLPKVYELQLEVVYEDDFLAVINKPGGISVSGNQFRTLENALPANLSLSSQVDAFNRLRAVHRLDSPTSGLLLIGKTASAHDHLGKQFAEGTIKKQYQAIVIGNIPEKGQMDLSVGGKDAYTSFQVVRRVRSLRNDWLSLVKLIPTTGRTHQLRIHLANLGFPILGDKQYGREGMILRGKGLFLCATSLTLLHPSFYRTLSWDIDPPNKFNLLLEREQRRWEAWKD